MRIFSTILFSTYCLINSYAQIDSLDINLEETDEGVGRAEVLFQLFKRFRNSEPKKAISFNKEALEISQNLNYKEGISKAYNNYGVYYKQLGAFDKALDNYYKGLKIARELNNKERIAFALSNIGTIHTTKKNYEKALESFLEAKDLFQEIGNPAYLKRILNNIGNVYFDEEKFNEALIYYNQALEIGIEGGVGESFDVLSNIGNIYSKQEDYEKALDFYFRSLESERTNKNLFGQAHALFNIGETYRRDNRYQLALSFLEQGGNLAKQIEDKLLLNKIYLAISQVHSDEGNFFSAYAILKLHMRVKDSLFNSESSRRLAELETIYEVEKKEKEIEVKSLQLRNQRLITFALIFTFASILAVALLIYLKYRQNQKSKKLLEEQNIEINKGKIEVESQKKIIEAKNQDITDSLEYAKGVQTAILNKNKIYGFLEDSFIFYQPKDIVSGDFYWYSRKGPFDILAAVDCTGHGVAGAFMTIIGNSLLNQIVNENDIIEPEEILKRLDEKVVETLEQREVAHNNHGMDVALCRIDRSNQILHFAGAKRPLYCVNFKGELEEIKGSSSSIADNDFSPTKTFESHLISYKQGDSFFIFSDGYVDQFGGEHGKKFLSKNFKELLKKNAKKSMKDIEKLLKVELKNWKGSEEQTDDILVMGFRL